MSEKEDTILPASNSDLTDTDEKGSVVDMMLGKSSEKVIDSNIMIVSTSAIPRFNGFTSIFRNTELHI